VRRLHESLPTDALKSIGIQRATGYIGSGFYIVAFEFTEDFHTVYRQALSSVPLREFLVRLMPLLEQIPSPAQLVPASLPLADELFDWDSQHFEVSPTSLPRVRRPTLPPDQQSETTEQG
jgi:hypothetical protein